MITITNYVKDIEDLYNSYLNENNGDIGKTLKSLEANGKLPITFMRYFNTDEDFRKKFNISEEEYSQNCNYNWVGQDIFTIR